MTSVQAIKPHHYCAYFDFNYLTRGLALHASLQRHSRSPFFLWLLCLDRRTYEVLARMNISNVRLFTLDDLEKRYPALLDVKVTRSAIEYFWTCKSFLPTYAFEHDPSVELITYLDSDLYFYSDPQSLWDEIGNASIAILDHRFGAKMAGRAKRGIYNVGYLAFRCDAEGLKCLNWWQARCLEWCYAKVEPTRYAEQKYLDDWPARFQRVVIIQHPGAGLAPWNWMNYPLTQNEDKCLILNGEPLVFFHFAGLRVINRWLYDTGLSSWEPMPPHWQAWTYQPYMREVKNCWRQICRLDPGAVLMDRVKRDRFGPRVFIESWLDRQIGWIG